MTRVEVYNPKDIPLDYLKAALKETVDRFLKAQSYYILPESKRSEPLPEDINNGFCFNFIDCVVAIMDRQFPCNDLYRCDIRYKGIPHAFIEYKGIYYDAECIEGTDDFTKLPIFNSTSLEICPSS